MSKNRQYKIKLTAYNYSMVIIDNANGQMITEYKITRPLNALNEVKEQYKMIDEHLSEPNATLYNYQW
jgi:hypothetical protein